MKTYKATVLLVVVRAVALASLATGQDVPCAQKPGGPSGGGFQAQGLAVYANTVLSASTDVVAGDNQWRVEKRVFPGAMLDRGFGSGGVLTSNPSSGDDFATAIVTDGLDFYIAGTDVGGP